MVYTFRVINRLRIRISILLVPFLLAAAILPAQSVDYAALNAADDFRWGVRAYHEGRFNDAVRAFERSLSGTDTEPLVREWLGYAYYRSGFNDTAISIWNQMDEAGEATAVLKNRIDILSGRAGLGRELAPEPRYVVAATIDGANEEYTLFSRPSSVCPASDGGFYATVFAGNEVLKFNANGALRARMRGGIDSFNHPFDVYLAENGYLYVTEYEGDRVVRCTTDGNEIFRFGEKGRGDGQFIGPQFITGDGKGFLYISDFGNRRVNKFDLEGNFILSFGRRDSGFDGLRAPAGVAVWQDRVYVADNRARVLYEFDDSGNYIGRHGNGLFRSPEGVVSNGDGTFLIADGERVVSYSLDKETVTVLSEETAGTGRYLKAAFDVNGNILAADFDANRIVTFSELTNLYSGLYVQVDRIDSSGFPDVLVDITVQDRLGTPFTGLESVNFALTENRYPVQEVDLAGTGGANPADLSVVLSGSSSMEDRKPDIRKALSDILTNMPAGGRLRLVHTDGNPRVMYTTGEGGLTLRERIDNARFSGEWAFDTSLRLAASELIISRSKRAVIFITEGTLPEDSFKTYNLIDLTQYLRNNGIVFYSIILDNRGPISRELLFLAEETGGECLHLYRPLGVGTIVPDLHEKNDGRYTLSYRSGGDGGFGKTYIPLEVQVYYYTRSGRERSGYFAPIEF